MKSCFRCFLSLRSVNRRMDGQTDTVSVWRTGVHLCPRCLKASTCSTSWPSILSVSPWRRSSVEIRSSKQVLLGVWTRLLQHECPTGGPPGPGQRRHCLAVTGDVVSIAKDGAPSCWSLHLLLCVSACMKSWTTLRLVRSCTPRPLEFQ